MFQEGVKIMLKEHKFVERVRIRSVATLVLLLMAIPLFAQLPTGTNSGHRERFQRRGNPGRWCHFNQYRYFFNSYREFR